MTNHLYHVTTLKKLHKYLQSGFIRSPVRAWKDVKSAERFSKQTGRKIILRIRDDESFKPLGGHKGNAVFSDSPFPVTRMEL